MDHLQAISLFEAHLDESLGAAEQAALRAHLDACADCRAVLAAWDAQAPAPDLAPRLLARLRPSSPRLALPAWLAPVAAAAALMLALSAFWHPERAWLRADQAFAYSRADAAAPARLLELR